MFQEALLALNMSIKDPGCDGYLTGLFDMFLVFGCSNGLVRGRQLESAVGAGPRRL